MGHAEEDKELMMIRMETLKTMIGKLKTKTNQSTAKENCQSSSSTDQKPAKSYFERRKPVSTTRPTTLATQVSPSSSSIVSKSNRSHPGTSTPPSPNQTKRSPKRVTSNNASPLSKIRTKQNLASLLDSASQLSSHCKSIVVPSATTVSLNHSPSNIPAVTSLPLSATSLRILKINSLIQIPKDKVIIQTASNVTESKIEVPTVAKVVDQPSPNKNGSISTETLVKTNKPPNVSSSIKQELLKPATTFSKSYSDSEILLRKNLPTKHNTCNNTIPPTCRSAFMSVASKNSSVFLSTARPASTGPVEVSVINNHTRPSSLLLNHSPIPPTHKPIQTVKTTDQMQEHNSLSIALQNSGPTCSTTATNIKPVNKPPCVSRPPTHTITRPDKHRKAITNTPVSSTGPTRTTVVNKQTNISVSSASKLSVQKPQTGKILFERTGKVLFDRHAGTQNKTKFQAPTVRNLSSNQKSLSKTKPTANFAHEFQLIREKHASSHINTTRTKFFSTEYIPPEMSKKARVILSKYKVVRNKDHSNIPAHNNKRTDENTTYSQPTTTSTSNVANVPGKILFQRYKPTYARDYTSIYSKKVKRYHIRKPYKNFVSRRIKYIKRVDPNPFSMQVKPPVAVSGSPDAKAKKEIILSRHGTSYKVAGDLKSLRRLSSEKGHKSKTTYTKPIIHYSKHHFSRSTSKLSTRNVSAKQYVASQVLKKTIGLTARKKVTKEKYCLFYNRFGKCKRGEQCNFIHDADKIAICTRFLRGTCKDENCLFSHKLDPDKMPVCSYFLRGECSRDNCPYRHVKVSQSASVCDDFLKGYCPRGKECTKKHILECEEFITTGSCSKGKSCLLTHRQGKIPKRKNSGSCPPKGLHQKRKIVEENNEECALNGENNNNNESECSRQNKAKKHKLPKFVSEKIKLLRESTSVKPASFAGIKKLIESTTPTDKTSPEEDAKSTSSKDDFWNSDFIPLSNYSGGESEDEDSEFIQRMFTFK